VLVCGAVVNEKVGGSCKFEPKCGLLQSVERKNVERKNGLNHHTPIEGGEPVIYSQ
jgi:hypothetical protein